MATDILDLRGHHLESVRDNFGLTREERIKKLLAGGYIKCSTHPFVDFSVNEVQAAFSKPAQRFRIVAGLDFICYECPKRKGNVCAMGGAKMRFIGAAFNVEDPDISISRDYGFETGQVYTAQQIRARMGF